MSQRYIRHQKMLVAIAAVIGILSCCDAQAIPGFASQTGMPCSQCHTISFGPGLTEYGREFKLNGYTWGDGDHPEPIALMVQGGFAHTSADQTSPPVPGYSLNDNTSVDQV